MCRTRSVYFSCFTTAEQFASKGIVVKLKYYWSLSRTRWHGCIRRHGRKEKRRKSVSGIKHTHTHTQLNSLVSSADVYIPSSQYNTDELIASEAPSLPLISIISLRTHTRRGRGRKRERWVHLHKSHNISIRGCLWGVRQTRFRFSNIQGTNMII